MTRTTTASQTRWRGLLMTLGALSTTWPLTSALQVTPNSPCAATCQDSSTVDISDPNSSNTKSSDINCQDPTFTSVAGAKYKSCMTCLQTSTFSQGSESDTMWFLYNLRYAASYCLFGFPNNTNVDSTPCITSNACGSLEAAVKHGIQTTKNMTAFSYCEVNGDANDPLGYDRCVSCIAADRPRKYLANYFVALSAGCQQKPFPGTMLGLNDTIFSDHNVGIVDPSTLLKTESQSSGPGLSTPALVGIAAGGVIVFLIIAGFIFVCLRARRNRRARASAQADFYAHFHHHHEKRPKSDLSFQCQTHMMSPRFWPAAQQPLSTDDQDDHRLSTWKGQPGEAGLSPLSAIEEAVSPVIASLPRGQKEKDVSAGKPAISQKAANAAVSLHHLTTALPPIPPQAYTSPSSVTGGNSYQQSPTPSDFRSPMSADSVRSTAALLPIKPYVPAEHGVHGNSSPPPMGLGIGQSPRLSSHGWPSPTASTMGVPIGQGLSSPSTNPFQRQQPADNNTAKGKPFLRLSLGGSGVPPPPPPPPPLIRTPKGRKAGGNRPISGSPVESKEIQTTFGAPPKR